MTNFSFDDFVIRWKTSQIGFNLVFRNGGIIIMCDVVLLLTTKVFSCSEAFDVKITQKMFVSNVDLQKKETVG